MNEVEEYFESKASSWDETSDRPGIKHMAVAHMAGVASGARVLDIGCGTGIMEPALCACGASLVVALDLSKTMVEIAAEKYKGLPVEFVQADVVDYAQIAKPHSFDVAVLYNMYPHVFDKEKLAFAVSYLLVPGGRFVVAHGRGRAMINEHHASVPASVTSELKSAMEESAPWRIYFEIDELVDTPHFYAFGGFAKLR